MDQPSQRPRPHPRPDVAAAARGQLTAIDVQPSQVVAAAGSAIVTAARVGRLLGRSGWRLARQLPGARTVEREAQRLQSVALNEARRILQIPQALPGMGNRPASPEEQRAADYVRSADPGAAPLRSAMSELLERSLEATRTDSRDYLYGTIISQLVPDEARIVAALSGGAHFAAADVVQKQRRGKPRVLLANASAVGRQAGLVTPDNTPTYLTRLQNFGVVEFGPEEEALSVQYDILATDTTVQGARESVEARRRGSVRIERKVVQLSPFGRQFWTAADPSRPALPSS
ncbi:MAG: Abi-alpha family protein [Jatrophihabitantaceae bacterium]